MTIANTQLIALYWIPNQVWNDNCEIQLQIQLQNCLVKYIQLDAVSSTARQREMREQLSVYDSVEYVIGTLVFSHQSYALSPRT